MLVGRKKSITLYLLLCLFVCFLQPRRNTETPEDKTKRREQSRIRSAMKQRESKRLRMAQSIQRELEEVAVKQADLEKEGIVVEKALRSGSSERTLFCPKDV